MKFNFTKWHGCGNDFIFIDGTKYQAILEQIIKKVPYLCDRHRGIGADGVIFVLPSEKSDFRMQIFNSDGSEAEMCGNGIRCFAKYVYQQGWVDGRSFTVETKAGIMKPTILHDSDDEFLVRVDMGEPILAGKEIPVKIDKEPVVAENIEVEGEKFQITCVSMGNPHCIIFVPDAEKAQVDTWGPILEKWQLFPQKTNVEFVQVLSENKLRMRVWERGAGITMACGTGACASLTAAVLNKYVKRGAEVELQLDGGSLKITWAEDGHIYMTGPAKEVFKGCYEDAEKRTR